MKFKARLFGILSVGLIICLIWLINCRQKTREISLQDPEIKEALAGICARDLRSHLGFLASDELQGRSTPSIYLDIAGRYLQAEFNKYGLTPGGKGDTYEQPYSLSVFPLSHEDLEISYSIEGIEKTLNKEEMIPIIFGTAGTTVDISGNIIYAGYGITSPENNWDDYKDMDVKGSVVLVMEGAPWELDLDVPFGYDKLLGKWLNASQHGAVGIIYATPFFGKKLPMSVAFLADHIPESVLLRKSQDPQIPWIVPGIVTSFEVANEMIMSAKKGDLYSLKDLINKENQPTCFPVEESTFSLRLESESKESEAFNVVGILKGSDPKLAEEYIVITAHYDHVGVGPPVNEDSIYNGADDNASGTAGVLELAQALSSLSEELSPQRSILFLLVSGEEMGLYGSTHFVENSTVPLSQIKANINLDMIGRCPETGVEIIAPGSAELAEAMMKSAQLVELKTQQEQHPEMRLIYLSDQFPFVYNNIPAVFCFTSLHADYHQPSDEVDKINFIDMEKIVKAVFLTTMTLANKETIPEFIPPAYFIQK
jgi:hypothetical protein